MQHAGIVHLHYGVKVWVSEALCLFAVEGSEVGVQPLPSLALTPTPILLPLEPSFPIVSRVAETPVLRFDRDYPLFLVLEEIDAAEMLSRETR